MNHINSIIAVGAPYSKARYQNATRICRSCLESEPKPYTDYMVLYLDATTPLQIPDSQCYVCEREHIMVCAVKPMNVEVAPS